MGSTIIPRDNNPEKLDESEQAVLLAKVFQTPDPARHGTCAWTLADLCDFAEVRFGKRLSTSGMSGVLQRPGLSHRKARSVHPKTDPQAQAEFQKKDSWTRRAPPDKTIRLWFQNEARIGQKSRICHRWWQKGQPPLGRCDKRFKWDYIFGAVAPETGDAFGLVLPMADTAAMSVFIAVFAKTLPGNEHAVMVLDQAGWHGTNVLEIPDNGTLATLPPYNPEINPVERLWLYLRERYLSLRAFEDQDAIIDASCQAWNAVPDNAKCINPFASSRGSERSFQTENAIRVYSAR